MSELFGMFLVLDILFLIVIIVVAVKYKVNCKYMLLNNILPKFLIQCVGCIVTTAYLYNLLRLMSITSEKQSLIISITHASVVTACPMLTRIVSQTIGRVLFCYPTLRELNTKEKGKSPLTLLLASAIYDTLNSGIILMVCIFNAIPSKGLTVSEEVVIGYERLWRWELQLAILCIIYIIIASCILFYYGKESTVKRKKKRKKKR